MKRLLLIWILLLVGGTSSYGQQHFNKVDPVHSFKGSFTSVIERNDKFYCTGWSVDSSNIIDSSTYWNISGLRFTVFDSVGNKIRDTFYQHPSKDVYTWSNNMHQLSDGGLVLVASAYEYQQLAEGWITRVDSLGNIQAVTEITKFFCTANDSWEIMDLQPTGTGEWIAAGAGRCGLQLDPFLIKFDSNFNVIWYKHYPMMMYEHNASKVKVLDDGYLIASGKTNYGLQWQNFFWNAELIKTDTAGVQQWAWLSDADSLIGDILDVVSTQDGGYIYCGKGAGIEVPINSNNSDLEFRSWIEKLDANRNVIWNKYLSPFFGYPNNILELEDGSLIIGGVVISGYDDQDTVFQRFASLQKLSSSGDIIWQRKYSPPINEVPQISDLKQTSDGGFVMVGDAWYTPWILKVDSNGCESTGVCNPLEVSHTIGKGNGIKIYPNPAGNTLYIEGIKERSTYRLLSITGSVIRSGTFHAGINQLFLQDVPSGMYLLHTGSEVIKVMKE